jgi:hypothetical protein
MAFDTTTRNRLAKFVAEARRVLTEEFSEQLQSLYGISAAGGIAPLERLTHLDAEGLELAATLRQRIAYLTSSSPAAGEATKPAIDRLTREQAFTVLNRLAAIRMAEKRGLIVESVGQQYQSRGFKVFESVAGSAIGDTYDRYRCYLFCLFDELAIDLGSLFDRRSPQALLFPREQPLLALLTLLDDADLQDLWAEDETIGWIYQYYNDPAERKKMREESAAPRNSRELAVRNQFFTPRYVVEFLTDNTLGRIWYEMTQGTTALKEQCRYLVRRPTEIFLKPSETAPEQPTQDGLSQEDLLKQPVFIAHRPLKDPRAILMLDPACGSMHFGLYAFDLFEAIYDEAWEIATGSDAAAKSGEAFAPFCTFAASFADKAAFQREVPRMIVEHNLHGIDIDPRAAQIAGLSLWLRAQRAWHAASVKPVDRPRITRSNIVCAEPMPGDKVLLAEFVAQQFPEGERAAFGFLLETVFDRMTLAGEAGSLLKIEEEIRTAIAEAKKIWEKEPAFNQRMLFGGENAAAVTQKKLDLSGITDEQFWEGAEERIYDALRDYAEQAESGGFQRRLFAEDAARGFAFIDVCRRRYDVALMNPPFGEAPLNARDYIGQFYVESKSDVGMAFVSCFTSKLRPHGRLGAITNRVFIANETLETWRDEYLLGTASHLSCLLDLGFGVLDGAKVEAAAFVLDIGNAEHSQATFVRVLDSREKEEATRELVAGGGQFRGGFIFLHNLDSFYAIPGHVLAYQLPLALAQRITGGADLTALGGKTAVGLQPSDDFRFVRLAWEVPPDAIGRDADWTYYAKGGEYQPYWDDIHLVVNWGDNGAEIRNFVDERGKVRSRPQNVQYYFRAGVTWPERTTSDFSPRTLPEGCIFSVVGQGIFCDTDNRHLAYVAGAYSRAFKLIVDAVYGSGDASSPGAMATHYRSGVLARLPAPMWESADVMSEHAMRLVVQGMRLFDADETSRYFSASSAASRSISEHVDKEIVGTATRVSQMLDDHAAIDAAVLEELGFDDSDRKTVDALVGPHPAGYLQTVLADHVHHVADLWRLSESELIRVATSKLGARRQLTMKSYAANRRLELVAHTLEVDARHVATVVSEQLFREPGMEADIASRIVSWLIGVAFGRWDIRFATSEQAAPELPSPFAPLPACPPGQLQSTQGLPAGPEDVPATYPIKAIPWDGILVDDPNHPLDIERRVREVMEIIWTGKEGCPTAEAIEVEACEILGVKTLRDYFRKPANFFADHLKRYSKSRRQAPIYWPLSTKSGSYTLWIYYHRLNDQTLHKCLADFLDPKIKDVESELGKLTGKAPGRAADLRDFLNELKDLKDEIERVIKLPWKPNLNDGVLITASPLWKLFRLSKWQKDLKACWEELEKGDYDWAHLAYTIWPERVEKVCEKDRSIAIAHGLEHLCKIDPPKPKKPRGKKASS